MCYNAGIELLNPLGPEFPPYRQVNAMARPVVPVRTVENPDTWQPMRWLLIPPGVSDSKTLGTLKIWLANARIEELEQKPLFRPLVNGQRCIVRFSWFYEWRHDPQGGKSRYRVALRNGEPMLLPGLFRLATIDGAPYSSFAVCTMRARGIMRFIHNNRLRQPVVVDEKGADAWLDLKAPIATARETVLSHEQSGEFIPDPPLQRDLFDR